MSTLKPKAMSRFTKSPDGTKLINLNLVQFCEKVDAAGNHAIRFWYGQHDKTYAVYDSKAKRDYVFNSIIDDNGS